MLQPWTQQFTPPRLSETADPGYLVRLNLGQQAIQARTRSAPKLVGELAWWHYLAAHYTRSVDLLSAAKQLRPGDAMLKVRLAWAMLEVHRYSDALQILQNPTYEPTLQPEKAMAQAVAYWQAQLRDEAMIDFNSALAGQPEWRNADWVKPLYSPLVARSIHRE